MSVRFTLGLLLLASYSVGAAELPRILIDTTYRKTTPGSTTPVASGANLQTAINAASCGDTLELEAGATFTGNFTLPDKSCSDSTWVYIRTATTDGNFPRPGNRVAPSHASLMSKITVSSGLAVQFLDGADHYRFIGIEIASGAYLVNLVEVGAFDETVEANLPTHVIFDRCYIHGHTTGGTRRGIAMNGSYVAVIDSYLSDFKEVGADSQAINGANGPGPYKIVNNYIEGAAENIMFGGSDPDIANLVPSDIEIRRNHFYKPLTWKVDDPSYLGTHWAIKNLLELKNAQRVLIENNLLEQNWADAQNGFGILFTVRNQQNTAPWSVVQDVTFRGNMVRHMSSGINILGYDPTFAAGSQTTERIDVRHNLFTDVTSTGWGGSGFLTQVLEGGVDYVLEHNTALQASNIATVDAAGGRLAVDYVWRYNITDHGGFGIKGDGTNCGTTTFAAYFSNHTVTNNVMIGAIADLCNNNYDASNAYPVASSNVGFVSDGSDYRLDPGSSYDGVGDGGSDWGAWVPVATAAENQRDWGLEILNGYTSIGVRFGVPNLPRETSCDVRVGSAVTTSTSGPSRRTVVVTGLTPASGYFVGVDCGLTYGGAVSYTNFAATTNPGGTKTVGFSMRPSALLTTVARVKVECSTSSDMSNPVSAQDTTCTSAAVCDVQVPSVPVGMNYCRHIYQTSGDVTVVMSAVQVLPVS